MNSGNSADKGHHGGAKKKTDDNLDVWYKQDCSPGRKNVGYKGCHSYDGVLVNPETVVCLMLTDF